MSTPTPTPVPEEAGFDPLVFWIQHKTKIVLLIALLVVGLVTFGIAEYLRVSKAHAAQALFAKAESADDYRKLISEYPGTAPAGNAHLKLAEKLREEGKFDESTATLKTFTEKYPDHQLISGAWTSIAANLEAQGKPEEALATYQKVSTSYANSFSAPAALLAQARLLISQKKNAEAERVYEQVMTQYQDNMAAQQAAQEIRRLKK
jgi:TolA-binding protein